MFVQALLTRLRKGSPTLRYPQSPLPATTSTFAGAPSWQPEACEPCTACTDACPTEALKVHTQPVLVNNAAAGFNVLWELNYDRCILCSLCIAACPSTAISATGNCELAVTNKHDLVYRQVKRVAELPDHKEVQRVGA